MDPPVDNVTVYRFFIIIILVLLHLAQTVENNKGVILISGIVVCVMF